MKAKLLHDEGGLRTFAVVFETGEHPIEGLRDFAERNRVGGAQITAIGAFSRVAVGYFELERRDYRRISLDEQVEVLALTGNIGRKPASGEEGGEGQEVALHLHVVLGRSDGTARGGHLLEATVRPTLEVVVIETPEYLRRRFDPTTGLALIDLSA